MKIERDLVFENLNKGEAVILNVLSKTNFRKLHIKGSENLPLGEDPEAFCKEAEDKYGKDRMFIVYGDHFGLLDSFLAAQALEARGMKARNYSGGMQEWYRLGLPVDGTQVSPEAEEDP
jgi:rhodanese-related sulfurtransferase